ncbi:hypothetical protein SCA03_50740 [Streptomyces cacaoi]|uniref:Uncharacterized protein n=1 Tax=Streptomyces cacaoi TaxID=1898 RepID=A0A4Y3R710_STRCI|nr:hypothetical protein SCA03_50740 [Streptomyces cacaoi]
MPAADGARATAAPAATALTTSTATGTAGEVRGAVADRCWLGGADTDIPRSLGPYELEKRCGRVASAAGREAIAEEDGDLPTRYATHASHPAA